MSNRRTVHGFTLLEVLITLVLIAGALLGTAGMQSFAMKVNQNAQLRAEAVVLGIDMMERIEANNAAAMAAPTSTYEATFPNNNSGADCIQNFCSATELATYDLQQFGNTLASQLPGAT